MRFDEHELRFSSLSSPGATTAPPFERLAYHHHESEIGHAGVNLAHTQTYVSTQIIIIISTLLLHLFCTVSSITRIRIREKKIPLTFFSIFIRPLQRARSVPVNQQRETTNNCVFQLVAPCIIIRSIIIILVVVVDVVYQIDTNAATRVSARAVSKQNTRERNNNRKTVHLLLFSNTARGIRSSPYIDQKRTHTMAVCCIIIFLYFFVRE